MGLFDRLFGGGKVPRQEPQPQSPDEQAIARYRYMLKTAPPETIEQAHAEAFAQLTPEQRRMLLQQLNANVPEAERASAAQSGADPKTLARMATRAEVRHPGTMERTFGRMGGGVGLGGMMAGTFFSTMAGAVLGSMIAQQFFSGAGADAGGFAGEQSGLDANQDTGENQDTGDYAADDFGGDMGDFGDV